LHRDKNAITAITLSLRISTREPEELMNELTYLDVDVADFVDSSDYRSSDYRWEYVGREICAGIPALDELQSKTASVPGIRKGPYTCLIRCILLSIARPSWRTACFSREKRETHSLTPVPLSQTMIFLPLLSISMCCPVKRIFFFSLFLCHTLLNSSHITSSIEWLIPADITGRYRFMSQKRQTLLSNGFTVSYHSRRFVPKVTGSSAKKGKEKKENRRSRTWIYSVHTSNSGSE